ncbi:MAG: DUF2497 domain-containing protein [Alphaproteobacteria bacterium]
MADETQTEDEPSIEEILDSIRQIISEDEDEAGDSDEGDASAEPEAAAEEEPLDQSAIDDMDFDAPAAEEEPLDQSAIDDMDFDTPAAEEEPVEVDAEDDIVELTDKVEDAAEAPMEIDLIDRDEEESSEPEPTPEPEPIPEPEPEPTPEPEPEPEVIPEPTPAPPKEGDALFTQAAEAAAVQAIGELTRRAAVEHNGVTLEDIVRTELRPLLKDWLDRNLPTLIERLVSDELERVSKRVFDE